MKPKWGDIIWALKTLVFYLLSYTCIHLWGFLFALTASHYWASLLFTVAVSRDYKYGFYDYTNRKGLLELLLYLIKNGNMTVCQEDFELNRIK